MVPVFLAHSVCRHLLKAAQLIQSSYKLTFGTPITSSLGNEHSSKF